MAEYSNALSQQTFKAPVREVLSPPRKGDLFIQPKDFSASREVVENHNRMRFASHFAFADPYTGNTRTYDQDGRYNCGRCNQVEGNGCELVDIMAVDREAGSCREWENQCAGDPEMRLRRKTIEAAVYGIAGNGIGFGCHRCPFASAAYHSDSVGRSLYCGKGDFRTYGDACCELNGAPEKKTPGEYK